VAVLDFAVVPAVHALRGELHQTFSNLISNAIDAMRDSGGQLKISVQQGNGSQEPGVLIYIEDTGTGIPSENIPRLFEPFFTTKPASGTGLGLWVVHQFVASWGGTIQVGSSTDTQKHGTTFTIYIPAVAAAESKKKPNVVRQRLM
jgi:signal transduction histidine kinase